MCELTAVGPQHVNHSSRCAHDDLSSSLQLSNLKFKYLQNILQTSSAYN